TFTVTDPNGGLASAVVQITSAPSVPILTAPTAQQSVLEGASTSINLGTLDARGVGPWTVMVQGGDGPSSTLSPSGSGPLALAHTYADEGSYTITETVSESGGLSTSLTLPNPIVVADQPVTVTGTPITAIEGAATGSVVVATFTDPGGAEPL